MPIYGLQYATTLHIMSASSLALQLVSNATAALRPVAFCPGTFCPDTVGASGITYNHFITMGNIAHK